MKLRTAGRVALLLVVAVPWARAQEMELPEPAAEMAELDYFAGEWSCEGELKPGPFGPGGAMTSSVDIETTLGGFWQSGRVRSSMPDLPPMEGVFYVTWDPVASEYLMLWVDNAGAWARSTSKGWVGDTLTYEGEMAMAGQTMASRDSFTRGADGSMRHTGEAQFEGKWVPMMDETCRK